MSVIKVTTMKIQWCLMPQLSSEIKVSIVFLCQLFSTCYTAVWMFEKHLCNQGSHYEKYGRFPLRKGSHYVVQDLA